MAARRRPRREAEPQRSAPPQPLADFLIRKLAEQGPMPQDKLRLLAVQEGYFPDGDAERGVPAVLMHVVKAGHIRQLPNGDFAGDQAPSALAPLVDQHGAEIVDVGQRRTVTSRSPMP